MSILTACYTVVWLTIMLTITVASIAYLKTKEGKATNQPYIVTNIQSEMIEYSRTLTKSDYRGKPIDIKSSNINLFMKYFTERKNLHAATAAGIVANLKAESGLNPTKVENRPDATNTYIPEPGIGFGIAQWTTKNRQDALVKFAKKRQKPIIDLNTQLDFLWYEMNTDYLDVLIRLKSIDGNASNDISGPMEAAIVFHGNTNKIKNNPIIARINPSRGVEESADSAIRVIENRCKVAEDIYYTYELAQLHQRHR
jgi:hypothetical protein